MSSCRATNANGMSDETPWISVGDTVWLIDESRRVVPVRVKRVFKMGRAEAVPIDQRTGGTSIYRFYETIDWWRDEASALAALRARRRSSLTRDRDYALRALARLAKEWEDTMRQIDESKARARAHLAQVEASLAALDEEEGA